MQGQLLQADSGGGLILGQDGNRYRYAASEWKGAQPALAGQQVDFVVAGEGAEAVFPLAPPSAPPLPIAGPAPEGNSVLLGVLGIACLVLGFGIPVLPTVAAFILGLVGASSAKQYRNGTGLVLSRIAWMGALVLALVVVALFILAGLFARPLFELMLEMLRHAARQGGTIA